MLIFVLQAHEQGAGWRVLAAKRQGVQKGGTPSDRLQRPPERREHTPGRAGVGEGQVAVVQGDTSAPTPPRHSNTASNLQAHTS